MKQKLTCPACGSKKTGPWKQGLLICHACKGRWHPGQMDEGGDYSDYKADERLIRDECGGPTGYSIRNHQPDKGGL